MLSLKQIERASKIVAEIKQLDQDIINIDKAAMQVANSNVKINLNIGILDLDEKEEEENKVQFDRDGSLVSNEDSRSLMRRMLYDSLGMLQPFYPISSPEPKDKPEQYYQELSNNDALCVFAVLLRAKQTQREELINKLKKLQVLI